MTYAHCLRARLHQPHRLYHQFRRRHADFPAASP